MGHLLCYRTSFHFLISLQKITKVEDGFKQTPPVEGRLFFDDPILPALLHHQGKSHPRFRFANYMRCNKIQSDLVHLGAQIIPQLRHLPISRD